MEGLKKDLVELQRQLSKARNYLTSMSWERDYDRRRDHQRRQIQVLEDDVQLIGHLIAYEKNAERRRRDNRTS